MPQYILIKASFFLFIVSLSVFRSISVFDRWLTGLQKTDFLDVPSTFSNYHYLVEAYHFLS